MLPDLKELNLDCMSPDDLSQIIIHLADLHKYAQLRSRAMELRRTGKVIPTGHERQSQDIYNRLPKNWQW
jgi:hypothetical protein